MQLRLLFLLIITIFSSCLDLDEEKREREAKYGPDSLQKPDVSPLDTVFVINISNDYLDVNGVNFAYHTNWKGVDSLLKYSLTKKPGLTVFIEELGSDPKMVDTAEDILLRNNINEYTRFTDPKYPVFSKKYIEKKK
jgi:hypothetical protein